MTDRFKLVSYIVYINDDNKGETEERNNTIYLLKLINNSSIFTKENHKRDGGVKTHILISIDFGDVIPSFSLLLQ